jgi:hypothetical protein
MSRFYGTVQGHRGEATRMGSTKSGLTTWCASWQGAVRCEAYVGKDDEDYIRVEFQPWQGVGITRLLYDGPIKQEKA